MDSASFEEKELVLKPECVTSAGKEVIKNQFTDY